MVELAAAAARSADHAGRLTVAVGDVHELAFDSGAFDLVVALGVVPFLHSPREALAEMARVTRSGGWVLFSSDNKYRLNRVLDPRYVPFPGREALKHRLTRAPTTFFSYPEIKHMVEATGLSVERRGDLGFGPFTLLGVKLLAERPAIRLDGWLQDRADRGTFGAPARRGAAPDPRAAGVRTASARKSSAWARGSAEPLKRGRRVDERPQRGVVILLERDALHDLLPGG